MRKQTYLCLLLSVAAVIMSPALAATSSASSTSGSTVDALSIYSLQINPNPISAGSNITISLQIYDSYTATLQNVNLELEGSYPILNVSPSNPYLISSIGQGLYGGLNSYLTYQIKIPKNTPSGNYTLDLVAQYQTSQTTSGVDTIVTGTSTMPITFYVHGLPRISINPSISRITPGNVSAVSMGVMNSGYGTARNITITLLNSSGFSPTGTKTFSIGSLSAGTSENLEATYLVNSHITNGTYYIPVYVTYSSDQGTPYNQTVNQTIEARIQNPDIVTSIVASDPATLYSGYNQSLTLDIQNIGYGNANNVSVVVTPLSGVSILSSVRRFFIGSLAPGQSQSETVLVAASNYTGGGASLNSAMSYYSSNYQDQFSKNQVLNLSVAQSSIFSISGANYRISPGDTSVPLNLTFTNTGNIDAQQVQLSFQSSYPLTPVSGSAYIQNLEPGQSARVSFLVSADSNGAPGDYPITVYESWRQPNGAVQQTYSGSNNYYAQVSSPQSGNTGQITDLAIVAVVAVIVLLVAYRRINKSKAKKKTPKAL